MLKKLWTHFWKVKYYSFDYILIGVFIVQNELVKKGKKRMETLKMSEEALMLNNHRCCY